MAGFFPLTVKFGSVANKTEDYAEVHGFSRYNAKHASEWKTLFLISAVSNGSSVGWSYSKIPFEIVEAAVLDYYQNGEAGFIDLTDETVEELKAKAAQANSPR